MDFSEIVTTIRQRQLDNAPLIERMIEVQRRYNGDYVVPVPTQADAPELPPLTPAIIAEAIDTAAMRAASVLPSVFSPPLDPYRDTGVRSREYASLRQAAIKDTWRRSRLKLVGRRAYRQLAGYATTCLIVVPDDEDGAPRIETRDPLTAYPEPRSADDFHPPCNCGFVTARSTEWIRWKYPEARQENGGPVPKPEANSITGGMWDLVEWIDEKDIVIGILGPTNWRHAYGYGGTQLAVLESVKQSKQLRRWKNKAGCCTVAMPARVTLDRLSSQIANITGIVDLMAKLQALSIMATEKSIFKDRYVLGDEARAPRLVDGEWHDGRTGKVNVVLNASSLGELSSTPDPQNQATIDRLERNARVSTGYVPQFGGESGGAALRTGRAQDAMMGIAVDPRVQELQEIMEVSLEQVNEAVLRTYDGYYKSKTFSCYSGDSTSQPAKEFKPAKHLEGMFHNTVSYAIAGADIQGVTIQLGQLFGTNAISMETFRERHPWISDAEGEERKVEREKLEQAMIESIMQQAVAGAIPPEYLALIYEERRHSNNMFEAVTKASAKLKEQQAKLAPPPGPDQHAAPEQMPGLAPQGAAPVPPGMPPPEMPTAPGEIAPDGDLKGLRRMMEALSQTPPTAPPEASPVPM